MKLRTTLAALAALMVSGAALADGYGGDRVYEVTITNITKAQVFSPPVLVTHKRSIALFESGAPASDGIVEVAENGNGAPLADAANTLPGVGVAQSTTAPIPPGGSASYQISSGRRFSVFSTVGMLVNTNDAFFAVNSGSLPRSRGQSKTYLANAYDAGSEDNNEDCAFIPGPACEMGSGNARAIDGAEGFVYISNGVHGIADLSPAAYDWRNPVARVTIKRIR